jgi:hypothetical protein
MNKDNNLYGKTTMKEGGYYSLSTAGAKDVIDGATDLVIQAIDALLKSSNSQEAFTLADMGCADGGTSLSLIHEAVYFLQQQAPQRPIRLVYEDQPENDYNALFQNLRTPLKGLSLTSMPAVYCSAVPVSFYEQTLPTGTLDIGFCATAMHWLSHKPCDISNHVQAVGAQGEERKAFSEQGRKDWEQILLCRALELTPQGQMVIVNFCCDETGQHLGHTGSANIFDVFTLLWQTLVEESLITEDEFIHMTLPQYYRNLDEFKAPFSIPNGVAHLAGLRLEYIEPRVVQCPYAARFKSGEWDALTFAEHYIPTLRSWTESTFFSALSAHRSVDERQRIIDAYYNRYQDIVAIAPEQHSMDYVHAYIVIKKD